MKGMEGKHIKITTPTGRVFYGECIYVKNIYVGVKYANGKETAFNTEDVKVEVLPQAIESSAITQAQAGGRIGGSHE